jgi:hypothetical protein
MMMICFHCFSLEGSAPLTGGLRIVIGKAIVGLRPVFFVPRTPDFLSRLVALSRSMRLSLMKAAHAVLSGAA